MLNATRRSCALIKLANNALQRQFSTNVSEISQKLIFAPNRYQTNKLIGHSRTFCTTAAATDSNVDFETITNGDKELEHKLKVLMLEVEVMRQDGRAVPENESMRNHHWQELLNLPTISARRRYLEYLFKTEKKRENQRAKKDQRRQEYEQSKPEKKLDMSLEEFSQTYSLTHNNIFLRFYDSSMNLVYNNALIHAIQFGQKLVVDCGYDNQMTSRENQNCAKQLMLCFAENRFHKDPFDLHYCNLNPDSVLTKSLERHVPTMREPWFPMNVHEKSYLDLFPRDKLVYLTPHCKDELLHYDHDAVYIIGGIVDKVNNEPLSLAKAKREGLRMAKYKQVNNEPLSLAKAKREGLRMAKFPLDRYLQWGSGSGKSLTLNHVISILLDMKLTNDWEYSLRHVPKRKLMDLSGNQERDALARMRKRSQNKQWRPASNFGSADNNDGPTGDRRKFSYEASGDNREDGVIRRRNFKRPPIKSILYDDE